MLKYDIFLIIMITAAANKLSEKEIFMNIAIGENIKKIRTVQGLTQEQLAQALEVSPQAVSRWEIGSTYPDIELLPVIAGFFDVSLDELMGMDLQRKEEEIKKIWKEVQKLRYQGKNEEQIQLLREKIKEYPNSAFLLMTLAYSLFCYYFQSGIDLSEEDFRKYAEETVELCKRALKYNKGEDVGIDNGCRQLLVYNYANLDRYDEAMEIAESMPDVWVCSNLLRPRATKDREEIIKQRQANILTFIDLLDNQMWYMDSREDYSVNQKLELKQMMERVTLEVLGENPCFYNERLFYIKIGITWEFIKLKRYDEALDALEKAFEYAVSFEERADNGKYSVFWLDKIVDNRDFVSKHSEDTMYDNMLKQMTNMVSHDSYYETNERFKAIREKTVEKLEQLKAEK